MEEAQGTELAAETLEIQEQQYLIHFYLLSLELMEVVEAVLLELTQPQQVD